MQTNLFLFCSQNARCILFFFSKNYSFCSMVTNDSNGSKHAIYGRDVLTRWRFSTITNAVQCSDVKLLQQHHFDCSSLFLAFCLCVNLSLCNFAINSKPECIITMIVHFFQLIIIYPIEKTKKEHSFVICVRQHNIAKKIK